jgi:23S rRNA (uracil1939-C5)-methyltransferase
MRPIIPSPSSYHYRNRITVHAQDGVVGFFRRESHRLIDIKRCPIAQDDVNEALADLRTQQISDGHYTLRAASRPRFFSQTNDAVANALRDLIVKAVPASQELLVDAYCGAGFLAKALLDKFERVIGIDWDKFAIETARENASAKECYIAGNVDLELERLLQADAVGAAVSAARTGDLRVRTRAPTAKTTLIVDPPAVGLSPSVRKVMVDLAPATLIYVSCNPATLARDLKELGGKFRIESVTPLDMFPQTAEIEVAVHLQALN